MLPANRKTNGGPHRPTFPEHCRCCPGTDSEVTNMVTQRSMNTVPIRLHIRRRRTDLRVGRISYSPRSDKSAPMWETLPVFVEQQDQQPDATKDDATRFSHGEGPRYSRHTVGETEKHRLSVLNAKGKGMPQNESSHLSRKISGSGGYMRMSGTLSCTITMTKEVNPNTKTT